MPVIRVSQKLWKEVTEVAGKEGVSLSYALDKILDESRAKERKVEHSGTKSRAKSRKTKGAVSSREKTPEPARTVGKLVEGIEDLYE